MAVSPAHSPPSVFYTRGSFTAHILKNKYIKASRSDCAPEDQRPVQGPASASLGEQCLVPFPCRRPAGSQGLCGQRAGLDLPVGHLLPRRAQPQGENHRADQQEEPDHKKSDQGCFGSSRTQILAKEIELFLAGVFCEKAKGGVRPLPFPGERTLTIYIAGFGEGAVITVGGHCGRVGCSSRRRCGGVRNPVVWTKKTDK